MKHLLLTDRNTRQRVLMNLDYIMAAWTVPNREDHTTLLLAANDGQGRTRELSVTESPTDIFRALYAAQEKRHARTEQVALAAAEKIAGAIDRTDTPTGAAAALGDKLYEVARELRRSIKDDDYMPE